MNAPLPIVVTESSELQLLERFVLRCLPTDSIDSQLRRVVGFWLEALGVERMLIAVRLPGESELRFALQSQSEMQACLETVPLSHNEDGIEQLLHDLVHENGPGQISSAEVQITSLGDESGSRSIGWLAWSAREPVADGPRQRIQNVTTALFQSLKPVSAGGAEGDYEDRLERERLEAMAEFAAGAGHEINNPLATIVGRVQLLMRQEEDADRRRSLAIIGAQAYRIRDMIGDAMLFARPPRPDPSEQQAGILLASAITAVNERYQLDLSTIALIQNDPDDDCFVDPDQFVQAVVAVLINAVEANSGQKPIRVELSSSVSCVRIRVQSATGLTAREMRFAFNPFYSGRQAGRGLGFGLSLAWRIVTGHRGRIRLESSTDETTEVILEWPRT